MPIGVYPRESPEKRFWAKVHKTSSCWLWTGATVRNQYGKILVNGKLVYTHIYSYELHFGTFLPGLKVCHHCDCPPCVRPSHLFLGTMKDNQQDAANKNRMAKGSDNGTAKLTSTQVKEIRALSKTLFQYIIAERYGISQSNVSCIVRRERWKHIE